MNSSLRCGCCYHSHANPFYDSTLPTATPPAASARRCAILSRPLRIGDATLFPELSTRAKRLNGGRRGALQTARDGIPRWAYTFDRGERFPGSLMRRRDRWVRNDLIEGDS